MAEGNPAGAHNPCFFIHLIYYGMRIRATYTGEDGSLGYRTGKPYTLSVGSERSMVIVRTDGTGMCPYESLSSFLKNWTNIQVITKSKLWN